MSGEEEHTESQELAELDKEKTNKKKRKANHLEKFHELVKKQKMNVENLKRFLVETQLTRGSDEWKKGIRQALDVKMLKAEIYKNIDACLEYTLQKKDDKDTIPCTCFHKYYINNFI